MGGRKVFCNLMIKSQSFNGLMFLGYELQESFLAFYFFLGHTRKLEQAGVGEIHFLQVR